MRAKPTNLKILEGNRGKRRLPQSEPRPRCQDAPEPPADLSADARAEWDFIVDELHQMGVVARIDRTLLFMLCEAVSRWQGAERIVRAEGPLLTTQHGNKIPHPAIGISNVARRDALRLMIECGLTPAARSQMETAGRSAFGGSSGKYFGGSAR